MINAIIEVERELYLEQHPENSANGFYNRNLLLTTGNLEIKVPKIRNNL